MKSKQQIQEKINHFKTLIADDKLHLSFNSVDKKDRKAILAHTEAQIMKIAILNWVMEDENLDNTK